MASDYFETEQACDSGWAAQQYACPLPLTPYGIHASGAAGQPRAMTNEEMAKHTRECAAQQAIYVLEQARQIRANPALMADVRAYIRKLRADGAALLDDIGGGIE